MRRRVPAQDCKPDSMQEEMHDTEVAAGQRSPSADSDALSFSPDEFTIKIDFKYLEKCLAFLVRQEQSHKQRIQDLESRLETEVCYILSSSNLCCDLFCFAAS